MHRLRLHTLPAALAATNGFTHNTAVNAAATVAATTAAAGWLLALGRERRLSCSNLNVE
jgi:hypothetical protein